MKQTLGVKINQSLSLTVDLQQSIRILGMSTLELQQEIALQLESNPLLALDDSDWEDATDSNPLDNTTDSLKEGDAVEKIETLLSTTSSDTASSNDYDDGIPLTDVSEHFDNAEISQELALDVNWGDLYDYASTQPTEEVMDPLYNVSGGSSSINDKLLAQLHMCTISPLDKFIAMIIIDGIDDSGFLRVSITDVLQTVQYQLLSLDDYLLEKWDIDVDDIGKAEIEAVRKRIMHLEPLGCGCLDLTEYLRLQVSYIPDQVPYRDAALTLLAHTDLLAKKDKVSLLKLPQMNENRFNGAMGILKSLHSHPVATLIEAEESPTLPDIVVNKQDGKWRVQLNPDVLPKLSLNQQYMRMIGSLKSTKAVKTKETLQYLKDNQQQAKHLIRHVQDRNLTVLKVAEVILSEQRDFLEYGAEAMKPMILRDVADQLGLHESTISRATSQKFILTPQGLFELKYFFSSHVSTSVGGDASSTSICARIKKMIESENSKKPLSDQKIADQLCAEGVDIARRTVAKYRESIGILSSSERKVLL